MAAQRKVVPSPDLWGWPETDTVEATRLTERGSVYSVDRIHLNGEVVGFAVGRVENYRTGAKMWDYVVGDHHSPTPRPSSWRLVFGQPSRQHALVALVESVKARAARKAGA
jgi:hypothetical protein